MTIASARVFGLVLLCVGLVSCVPIDSVAPRRRGELKIESVTFKDAIPKELGKALGVTLRADNPDIAELWFEKPDGTIVLVSVDCQHGRLGTYTLVIPRS